MTSQQQLQNNIKDSVFAFTLPYQIIDNAQSNITAFYIHDKEEHTSKELEVALGGMESSDKWVVVRLGIDTDIATAFRVVKIPSLIIYNSNSEETSRVFGAQNIIDMLTKIVG